MKRICAFLGSANGTRPEYQRCAQELGSELARRSSELVYGGASVGLMGVVAEAALGAGGRVIGVIPRGLEEREIAHGRLSELRVVGSMHERKEQMYGLSDAFVTLPGGVGTADETLEIMSWAHLGLHGKPIGFLNALGYYDALLAFFDRAVSEGFMRSELRNQLVVAKDVSELLDLLVQ